MVNGGAARNFVVVGPPTVTHMRAWTAHRIIFLSSSYDRSAEVTEQVGFDIDKRRLIKRLLDYKEGYYSLIRRMLMINVMHPGNHFSLAILTTAPLQTTALRVPYNYYLTLDMDLKALFINLVKRYSRVFDAIVERTARSRGRDSTCILFLVG